MKKKIFNVLYYVLMLVLACVFMFSAWMLYTEMKNYKQDEKSYQQLEQYVSIPEVKEDEVVEEKQLIPSVDFDGLLAINKDFIGWIYVPDTRINYPVVQGSDNEYYLKHLFDKTYGISGTVFMDASNDADMSDRHTILYGHHMKNGTMFADAEEFENQDYADAHQFGYYITKDAVYEIEFFAGYVTDAYNDSWVLDFTDAEFEDWLHASISRSAFESDVMPELTDRIMTLSTCSYDIADGRFVLLGILREKLDD